jgi:hypothetical protein
MRIPTPLVLAWCLATFFSNAQAQPEPDISQLAENGLATYDRFSRVPTSWTSIQELPNGILAKVESLPHLHDARQRICLGCNHCHA